MKDILNRLCSGIFNLWNPKFFYLCFLSLLFSISRVHASFDQFENWGFEQGGGLKQGNFVGSDRELVVSEMIWDESRNRLAVTGALADRWAVRVYDMQSSGPAIISSWDGDGSLNFSTATSAAWDVRTGKLICGIEHIRGGRSMVQILHLDSANPSVRNELDVFKWEYVVDMQIDPREPSEIILLGEAAGQGKCMSLNIDSMEVVNEFGLEEIQSPKAIVIEKDKVCFAGQKNRKAWIEIYNGKELLDKRNIGRDFYISKMVESGGKIFITGRSSIQKSKEQLENFFLSAWEWNGKAIKKSWSIRAKDLENEREWGTSVIGMDDGGILVGGNFRKSWLIGQSDPFLDSAMLTNNEVNFDSFIARYDENGSLLWAQNSDFIGNDYLHSMISDESGSVVLLGNRKIDGSFGPFFSKVSVEGNQEKNANLVVFDNSDIENLNAFEWSPPTTLRFAEPIDGSYFSASAVGKATFEYEIENLRVSSGEIPMFEPGEVRLTARLLRDGVESNSSTKILSGLKGRPYLKIGFDQNQSELKFYGQLFGLHPNHLSDSLKMENLIDSINFEVSQKRGFEVIGKGRVLIDPSFTGFLEVFGTFDGDIHYEAANRRLLLQVRDGRVTEIGQVGLVTIQVKDLDGWQKNRILKTGEEFMISATQGFGKNRKFNQWVEFSETNQKLRTARVQSPFSIRSAVIAQEDMALFAHYNFTFVGTAINGYLGGATVFLDFNLNGEFDDGEPFGFSSDNGGFELEITEEEMQNHDKDGNGLLDASEGMLVVFGGVDHSSKIPLSISYRAPPSYSVITAVSTLIAGFIDQGLSLPEAEVIVSQYLALPEGIDLASFEPLREVFAEGEKARNFILKATQLANLFNEGSRFLQIKSGDRLSRIKGAEMIVSALGDKILEQSNRRSSNGSTAFDLNDPTLLLEVINSADDIAVSEIEQSENLELLEVSSVRADLAKSQPEIAEIGNDQILNEMVDQISSANTMLDDLSNDPSVAPSEFKSLASATQNILNELGELTSNTLFEDEVDLLLDLTGSDAVQAQSIINRSGEVESLEEDGGSTVGEKTSLGKFSLDVLRDFSARAEINVYAPVLTQSEIISPAEFTEDLSVGSFSAYDPEGEDILYSIVGQNPDFDLDGLVLLIIHPDTGEIQVQDYDDLKLMNDGVLKPIIRLSDEKGLFREEEVEINLTDWTYLAGRLQIPDLALLVPENLPVGTIIHEFGVNDVYGGLIEYVYASGQGDSDNQLFTIDASGALKTAVVFDYESGDKELEIRLQAIDSRFNSVEKSLKIQVSDELVPNVQTGQAKIVDSKLQLNATMVAFGSFSDDLKLGFLFSQNPNLDEANGDVEKIFSTSNTASTFTSQTAQIPLGGNYYFKAFAENQEGVNYGTEKAFVLPRISAGEQWMDGTRVEDYSDWWRSDWFGLFHTELYPWVYHQNLGWVFVNVESQAGAWLFHEKLGWLWTRHDFFPYIFLSKRGKWTYVNLDRAVTTLYDYEEEEWFEPNTPIEIFGEVTPSNGGEVTGFGNYYRWDSVRLEAKAKSNSNFAGWSGDTNSMEPVIEFEAIRNSTINASFLIIPSGNASGMEVVSEVKKILEKMDHLTEAEKEKSIAELLIFGTSSTSGLSIKKEP